MFKWIKRLFKKKPSSPPRPWRPEDVVTDDPIHALIVSEAMNTGKMVIGHLDEDDNLHLKYTEIPKREEDDG